VAVTLPNSFPVGFLVNLYQLGTGTVTASPAAGGSLVTPNISNTPNQYSSLLCIVVSNSTGTNAQWDVIAAPIQSGGVVGAASLSSLYSQDTSAHYAQYTVAQILADGTSTNNGLWLKAGSGNGSGNWTQESTLTLSGLNALITALQTQVMTNATAIANAGKAVPPQQIIANVNAVRGRFTSTSDLPETASDEKSLPSYNVRLLRSQNVYNANVYSTFGEPQSLMVSDASATGSYQPVGGYFISVADLEAAGIVPGNSTYISAQFAIDIASAVNQTLDQVLNSANGQTQLILRYAGAGATQELYWNKTAYDIWFNCAHTPTYNNVTMTDTHYVGVFSASMTTTGNTKGYAWQNVWLPATYGGLALTGILLLAAGNETANGQPSSIQTCLPAVINGTTIVSGQAYLNPDDRAASFVPAANIVNQLDVGSSDKIIVFGDSIGCGFYNPRNKSWISKLSLFSDWSFENWSVSGGTYQTVLQQLLNDTTNVSSFPFGQVSFRDYKGSRVFLMCETNDQAWETQMQFVNDLKMVVKMCRDFGLVPTICSMYLNQSGYFPNGIQTLMRNVAEDMDVDFVDLRRHGKLFAPASFNSAEWQAPHPGVRANALIADPLEKYLKGVDQPRKSFKLFRMRSSVSPGSAPYDALMVDGLYDRAAVFEEIDVGHDAMLTGATHCDALTAQSGNYTTGVVESEHMLLRSGFNVPFVTGFGLIEACFPEMPDEVRLVLNDPNITVYVKDVLATPLPVTLNRYQGFVPSGSPSVSVGATYSSSNISGTFTYVGTWNGELMFTPAVSGKTAISAGTLTKTSGTGDATIGYNSSNIGYDQQYYTWYGLPPGHWTEVTGNNGVYALESLDLRSKVRRNKISFLLCESGGFYLSAPRVMYRSSQKRAIEPRKTYYRGQSEFRPPRGAELLTHNYTSNMAGWTVTGSLTPGVPGDAQMPQDPATGSAMTNCVVIDPSDYLSQTFTWTPSYEDDLEVEITIYARNYPALADPSPITADSFDWALLEIDIVTNAGVTAPKLEKCSLWWNELKFRTILPLGDSSATLVLKPANGASGVSTIQVAYASVKLVNA
jgi:hypothetical protein